MLRRQGGAHTRQCRPKAEHIKGGLWPPHESCYLSGVRGWPPHRAKRAVAGGWLVLRRPGGTHTRQCTHKAEHAQGGAHKRRSVANARVLLFKRGAGLAPASSEASRSRGLVGAPQARRYTHKAVHTQGGAHKGRSVATARVLLFQRGAGVGPRVKRSEP